MDKLSSGVQLVCSDFLPKHFLNLDEISSVGALSEWQAVNHDASISISFFFIGVRYKAGKKRNYLPK